jgi:hypothetical protein
MDFTLYFLCGGLANSQFYDGTNYTVTISVHNCSSEMDMTKCLGCSWTVPGITTAFSTTEVPVCVACPHKILDT